MTKTTPDKLSHFLLTLICEEVEDFEIYNEQCVIVFGNEKADEKVALLFLQPGGNFTELATNVQSNYLNKSIKVEESKNIYLLTGYNNLIKLISLESTNVGNFKQNVQQLDIGSDLGKPEKWTIKNNNVILAFQNGTIINFLIKLVT